MTIIVDQNRLSAFQKILFRLNFKSFKTPVLQHFFFCNFWRHIYSCISFDDFRWRMTMIQQGIII